MTETEVKTRWCVKCGIWKPLDIKHFALYSGRSGRSGTKDFVHHCRDCGKKEKKPRAPASRQARLVN